MIDTIVLTLNQNMFRITDHDKFEPSTKGLYNSSYGLGGRGYLACKQNPTQSELKDGIYKPRLTITKRFYNYAYEVMMKMEFSAPKLIYKNNFDELEDTDFDLVISTLQQKLNEMGVLVTSQLLEQALLSTIHYSKNIILFDGLTPYSILKEIQKSNITQRLDFNQTDFRNEGHSLKYRTNSFEIAFYDKLKDIQKAKISEKRAFEKDNIIQMDLFNEIQEQRRQRPIEILRMEIRLNQRQKIRQILKKLNEHTEPTFKSLFKKDIAKKVLLYYLDQIEENYPKALYYISKSTKDFMAQFVIDNNDRKLKDVFLALGFRKALDDLSSREIRELVKRYPKSSWYSFIRQENSYNYTKDKLMTFQVIRDSVEEFKSLKTVDFQSQMINNDKYN